MERPQPISFWESIRQNTCWGKYLTAIEERAVHNKSSLRGYANKALRVVDAQRRAYSEDRFMYKFPYRQWKKSSPETGSISCTRKEWAGFRSPERVTFF